MEVYKKGKRSTITASSFAKTSWVLVTISPVIFPAVTVTVVRDRKIRTAPRTNQIARFVTAALLEKNNRLYRSSSKLQNTFCFFKTCWRLTGYQGFMMPLNHQAGHKVLFKTTLLNILVDRALMHHISFLSVRMIYALTLDRLIRHNNLSK